MRPLLLILLVVAAPGCVSSATKREISSLEREISRLTESRDRLAIQARSSARAAEETRAQLEEAKRVGGNPTELKRVEGILANEQRTAAEYQERFATANSQLARLKGELAQAEKKADAERSSGLAELEGLLSVIGMSLAPVLGSGVMQGLGALRKGAA